MRRPWPLLACALLAACAHRPAPAAAPPRARLAWEVLGHGRLVLEIPPGWTVTPGDPDPPLPATLRLEPPEGRVELLLTPTWDPAAPPEAPAPAASARQLVELARRQAAQSALEPSLPLLEVGGGVEGWYFAATDRELARGGRAPTPDEYRCLLQGAAAVGGLTLAFSLLDDADGPHRAQALEVVRRARHLPTGAGRPERVPELTRPGGEGPGGAVESPAPAPVAGPRGGDAAVTLGFPGKGWAVAVDLPGFLMQEPDESAGGQVVSLLGQHPASGVVASLVLSAAGERRNAADCAAADWTRLVDLLPELRGGPAPGGERPRAAYLVRDLRGQQVDQQNASGWWYRDGVCVHAHVSLMGFEAGEEPALDRILASVRFDEPL